MVACPKGHESDAADYCDVCGTLLAGAPVPLPVTDPEPVLVGAEEADRCVVCDSPLSGRFCEVCGHDSLAPAPANGSKPEPAAIAGSPVRGWSVVVSADREYFERVKQMKGPDAGNIAFPRFCPERRFPLSDREWLIGRRSQTRGVYPDIDLIGPPEDTAVSHTHALLVPQPGGTWAIIDLGSTNRTYLNGDAGPIRAEEAIALTDGTVVNLGAWTRLTLHGEREGA